MQNVLRIPLHRSRLLAVLLVLAHGLALSVVWVSSLSVLLHLGLKLALLASLVFQLDQAGWLRAQRAATLLRIRAATGEETADSLVLDFADGRSTEAQVLPGSLVLPVCVVIQFARKDAPFWRRRGQLLLLPDAADAEDLRALRVRLRWGRHAPV
jgi:hypothetical protein